MSGATYIGYVILLQPAVTNAARASSIEPSNVGLEVNHLTDSIRLGIKYDNPEDGSIRTRFVDIATRRDIDGGMPFGECLNRIHRELRNDGIP